MNWTRKVAAAGCAAAAIVGCLSLATAPEAQAEPSYKIAWTGIGIFPRESPSMDAAATTSDALPDGTSVEISCELTGQPVSNGAATTSIWERLPNGHYLPNAYVDTGVDGWTPGVPRCSHVGDSGVGYDRNAAALWALGHVHEPERYHISDCTWFASNALWQGGLAQTPSWTGQSWNWNDQASRADFPGPTIAATSAASFGQFLETSGYASKNPITWSDNTAGGAKLGDIIAYDWNDGADGTIDHISIVTGFDENGFPEVSQHTPARVDRFWSWDPSANDWIENSHSGAKAYLFHIR